MGENKRLEKERKRKQEEVKPTEKEDNGTDGEQLKKEIEEEILREERRLKREDERREKARKVKEDVLDESNGQNDIDETKKIKHKRIEWPKSPVKQDASGGVIDTKIDKVDKEDLEDTLVMEIDQSDMVVEEPVK